MMTDEQSNTVNKILDYRRYRYYFDHLSDEFGRTKVDYKVDRLAILTQENLLDITIETYLGKYETYRLDEITRSLASTLKYLIGFIRYDKYPTIDKELSKLDTEDLGEIILLFKKEILNKYSE